MKQIGDIAVSRMNNGAHFLYVTEILERAEADQKVKSKAATQLAAFKAAVEQEDKDLKISQASMLTPEIAKADTERDRLYSGLRSAVKGFLLLPGEEQAQAARLLWQTIKDYDIKAGMQLERETGLLINLLADLEGKYKQQVELLALTSFVTALKAANERVRTLLIERTDERMGIVVGALKAARKVSDDTYRALVQMVNAQALVEGDEGYAAFIDFVNTLIVRYKREVLGQKAKPADTDPGDGPGTGGDTGSGGNNPGTGGSGGGNPGGDGDGGDDLS